MQGRVAETAAARLEHTLLPPHEEDGFTSRTAAYAIGVAFTGQDAAVISHPGGRPRTVGFGPGTVGVNGARPLTWHRTTGHSENVEIVPSAAALVRAAAEHDVAWEELGPFRQTASDPVVWVSAVRARRMLLTERATPGAVEELTGTLLAHVAVHHLGARAVRPGRLDRAQVGTLTGRVHADPFGPHPVDELAASVHLSPFHFLRTFTRTFGTTPHRYVTAVRAERVRRLLERRGASVASVAAATGLDPRQLRRVHHRVIGVSPRSAPPPVTP
jgi:AraC family transcriptional regulator